MSRGVEPKRRKATALTTTGAQKRAPVAPPLSRGIGMPQWARAAQRVMAEAVQLPQRQGDPWRASGTADAWARVCELLDVAKHDPAIAGYRPAVDLLEIIQAAIRYDFLARSAGEVLSPLERAQQAGRRKAYGERNRQDIKDQAHDLLASGKKKYWRGKSPNLTALATAIEVDGLSARTIVQHLRALRRSGALKKNPPFTG